MSFRVFYNSAYPRIKAVSKSGEPFIVKISTVYDTMMQGNDEISNPITIQSLVQVVVANGYLFPKESTSIFTLVSRSALVNFM